MQAIELADADIKALQVSQSLSAEFFSAVKRWAKATLALIDGPSAFADRAKEAVVISGKLNKFLKGLGGVLPVVKVDGRGMGVLIEPLSDALKALSAALKGKGVDDTVKALVVYVAWLDELAAVVSDFDEAVAEGMGRVAKAIPGGGVHAHGIRPGGNTETDGGHVHVLQLPGDETALTGRDGEHSHDKAELEDSAPDGEHSHVFRLPDGINLKVDASGEHTHETDGETTTRGGVHFHEVEIDGKKIQTALPDTVFTTAKAKAARDTAEVNASGEGNLPELALDKVTSINLKPAILRSPAVSLTGGIVNNGSTINDIDVLIHGPISTQLRRVIEFRLGRMFPSEINQRLSFHEDKLAGPFTDHIHLYDLALVPRDDRREIVRMSDVVKQDDPLMDWPKEPGKRQAVIQAHTRGKTLHLDVRFCMNDYLVGWTLFAGKKGLPDTNTVAQARELIRGYTTQKGNRYIKPLRVPSRVAATAKLRQPPVWLSIDEHVFEEGEIGATRNEVGVMVIMAKPTVQWGLQTDDYHEYFLEDNPVFAGQFFARFVVGTDSEIEEEGAQGEKGFWTFAQSKEPFPSVLKQRAIESGNMPPLGRSALPESLEKITPEEFRYWEAETEKEASETRAALVRARLFTPANVAIVDGQLRRIVRKAFLYVPEPIEKVGILEVTNYGKAKKSAIEKAMAQADGFLTVHKTAEERYMLGVVLEPNDGDGTAPLDPDTQKDIYSADEIRQAAHLYMERHRNVGHMHRQVLPKAKVSILESYIAPVDFSILSNGEVSEKAGKDAQLVRKGTWLLALRIIDDELWKDVKSDKLNGLSIGGSARRIRTQKS